jgi:hypothetical protein
VDEGVIELDPSAPLELWLENHEDEPLEGKVSLEIIGLGARRVLELKAMKVAPKSMVAIPWSPSKSPIAPVGATARLYARVAFERGGVSVRAPAQILSLAFSEDGSKTFLSSNDDTGVRLASLGRASAGLDSSSLTREDRTALLGTLAGRRGTVDGVAAAAPSQAKLSETVSLPLKREWLDTIEFDEAGPYPTDVGASGVTPSDIIVVPIPQPPCEGAPVTRSMCAEWAPEGFRDIGVASSVPSEDYSLNGPAAYANATVNDGLFPAWSGRLNGVGCSPPVTFCANRVGMVVSTASLAIPTSSGVLTLYGTREFKITPTRSYVPPLLWVYNSGLGTTSGLAIVASSAYPVRVAAAVSRILTMPDNGVLRHKLNYTAPTLNLHTENGCIYYSELSYSPGRFGEACGDADEAWFGPSLGKVNNTYVLTGRHTTDDAYTIGHELGHTAQRASNGGPDNAGYDGPTAGYCSCDHVTDGNQIHCLQSRHAQATAEAEGFGHFYAARVMNDQNATCRFTYYKNFRKKFDGAEFWGAAAPPVPIDCNVPYTSSVNGVQTQGWVPSMCPAVNASSEYDWLTFLWAVNGSATSAQRSSMTDLYAILGGAGQGENFTWVSVRTKAESHFGPNSTKAVRFRDSGVFHGVNH